MTKHTLVNKKTKEQYICIEIEIEGDKYYVPYYPLKSKTKAMNKPVSLELAQLLKMRLANRSLRSSN